MKCKSYFLIIATNLGWYTNIPIITMGDDFLQLDQLLQNTVGSDIMKNNLVDFGNWTYWIY